MGSPKVFLLVVTFFMLMACWEGRPATGESSHITRRHGRLDYPPARRNESVVDNYHGESVYDPYRWLENATSAETKAFVTAQNNISQPFFDSCPVKDNITAKLTMGMNNERFKCPMKVGGRYYYYHNTGLQNHDVLYVQDTLTSQPSVFLDPNRLSEDGSVSLSHPKYFSTNGTFFAYCIRRGGSDWKTIKVKRAPSGEDLSDNLKSVKMSSLAWTADERGFYYTRHPMERCGSTGNPSKYGLYYHLLGNDQCQDTMVYSVPHRWLVFGEMSVDDRYLIISVYPTFKSNNIYIVDLQNGFNNKLTIVEKNRYRFDYVTNVGSMFYWITGKDAPFKKIIKIDINNPDQWVTTVPESEQKASIIAAGDMNGKLVLLYVREAKSELHIHNLETGNKEHQVQLKPGTISCIHGIRTGTEMFFRFESFLIPGIIYRLDMTSYNLTKFRETKVQGFNPDNFETRQVFYGTRGGTRVPMFIVHKKNLAMTGDNPALLHGYGGFGVSITPIFDVGVTLFVNNFEGVYAFANIRGGGEYGEEWHKNGSLGNKQRSFEDFQTAGFYLIDHDYTNVRILAIYGASNGGLLVAACLNQRPEYFAAGVAEVGLMDMLRYELFTDAYKWIAEYGSVKNSTQFQWLKSYSPLHNIPSYPVRGQYPATLLLTAENDDRVPPLHSLKFIAELQHVFRQHHRQTNPLLLYMDTNAGHGGKSTSKLIEGQVRMFSFLSKALNWKWIEG